MTNKTMLSVERDKFESLYRADVERQGKNFEPVIFRRDDNEEYFIGLVQAAWWGYQQNGQNSKHIGGPVGATHFERSDKCPSTVGIQYYRNDGGCRWSYWPEGLNCWASLACKPSGDIQTITAAEHRSAPEIPKHLNFVHVLILQEDEQHYVEAVFCRDGKFRLGYDEDALTDVERWMPLPKREQPAPVADHTQCEECKGWGYHENHHEGGGTECGECSGSGKAPVEQFSADTVVCRRYQLEQHPGQNFYHYDLEPVYGSVPVTVSELITMVESAPVAVVMPEPYGLAMFKMLSGFDSVTPEQFNLVWTACRKEVARLNGVKP